MTETKAERRESWKQRTTESATALKKAGATVSRSGKRSIPLSAQTAAEIRVSAWRAETPERVVVDPVTGKHTRIDTRTGAATVISRAPGDISDISLQGFKVTDERQSQQSQRLAAERERAAASAAIVAEARSRPPDTTTIGPTPYRGTEYVPSPYQPGTHPEDVEYGDRPKFDQPQITDIHEVIGSRIDVSASRFKSGIAIAEGKDVDVGVAKVEEPEKYVTRNIHDFITEKTSEYRRELESERTQQAIRSGIYGTPFIPAAPEQFKKFAPERLVTGLASGLAMFPDIAASVALGTEHAIRTEGEVYKELPVAAGVMVGGMKQEAVKDPLKFIGEMAAMPLFTKYAPMPSVPSTIKTKVPVDLLFKERLTPPKGLTAEQTLKFEAGAEIATTFKHVEPPIMESLKFADIKALRGKSPEIVEAWIRAHPEQETVIAGSTAARAQFRGARKPGDVDLYVKDVTKAGEELYTSLSRELPPGETKLTRQRQHGAAIVEIKDPATGLYHHAVDIHQIPPAGSQLRYGMKTQDPVNIAGLRYVRAGELVQRKAESILQKQGVGKIGPKSHRGKDVADFISFTEELIAKRQKEASTASLFKGKKTKKAEALEEQLGVYKMYSTPSYELMVDTMAWYSKLGLPTKVGISTIGVGVTATYQKEAYAKKKKVVPTPYVAPRVSGGDPYVVPPPPPSEYVPPPPPSEYVPPPPSQYVPPPPPGYVPPPPSEYVPTPPQERKTFRLDLDKKPKKPVGRVQKETPGYAWQLANPIATLEQLLGGRTAPRSTRTAPRKKTTKKKRKGGKKR